MSLSPEDVRQATAEGAIKVVRCATCGTEQAMPASTCFSCGGLRLETRRHEGKGELFAWTRTHVAFDAKYDNEVPYTVLIIALDGGARVYGRLSRPDDAGGELKAGMRVALDRDETRSRGCPVFSLS